ncbi:uncharacterized protein UHOD_04960 [Ustilago sp. UG-2017b]|nr:uncharacterized protein UHOD_04960 [Ustilago sp. UG-2017b]
MSQSTPTALTKRKVMARMDAGPSESPSSSVTPNPRPRIVRAQHGYSSPSLSTPTASRPTPGTGRARVDMSAFASPSSAASSPAMSSCISGRPLSTSSAASATITAKLSAASPSVRSTPTFHARSASTVGSSASSYKLAEARTDGPVDPNLASLRSPKIRGRKGSVDLTALPAIASANPRLSGSSQLASSVSLRSPIPRADQSPFQKPATPSSAVPARHLLSPQRSQETLEGGALIPKSRSPSPVLPAPSLPNHAPPGLLQLSPSKQVPTHHRSEPVVSDRQASMPVRVSASIAEQRHSFASNTFSSYSANLPLSPSSETPPSPSDVGEAEEARVHRKLLDLEITNKSLMAINSALEVTKLKQAKEIRELKRRLRDSRGLLVVPATRDCTGTVVSSDDEHFETDSDQDEDLLVREDVELEAAHQRCKNLVDDMVQRARKAILQVYAQSESTRGKVLHPVEVEERQRELEQDDDIEADTTVATDLLETSMSFDQSEAGTSNKVGLPCSSSSKFAHTNDQQAWSSHVPPNAVEISESTSSLEQSRSSLHPNSPSPANFPPHADVSID